MQQYVNAFMSINLRLVSMGIKIGDELLASLMLKGLTKEYYPMRMTLENSNVTLTSELIKSKLLQDTEFGKNANSDSAFLSRDKFKRKPPKCKICGKLGHINKNSWFKDKDKANNNNHNNQHNQKFKGNQSSKSVHSTDENKERSDQRYTENKWKNKTSKKSMYVVSAYHVKIKDDTWVIDSGASYHIIENKTVLKNYKTHDSKEHEISLADDNVLTSAGFGDVKLVNDNFSHISDALHVPKLSTNLLSVNSIVNKDMIVLFTKDCCNLYDSDSFEVTGKVLAKAYPKNGIY
ncbi:hypothetical protein B7P43_G06228 [Cryptotermes secundus]|uniref:Retrovirus-related Pol polyprotein from transposon TNT 1-94-like beta-barrel domain-containing protein n=1 Tax=Cryptotermes secundus TaxID=105785 RepID=A0A2J7RJS5_9NEOP|nr:hypothetical protein B7P43_G06228 [Cryptotermes secundus]